MNKQIGLKRYEVDGRKVLFYFDEVKAFFVSLVSLVSARNSLAFRYNEHR